MEVATELEAKSLADKEVFQHLFFLMEVATEGYAKLELKAFVCFNTFSS